MPNIKPISELGKQFEAFAEGLQIGNEPIFLTKNGEEIMVAMNADTYWYDYLLIRGVQTGEQYPHRRYAKTGTKAARTAARLRRKEGKLKGVTYVHVYEEPGQNQQALVASRGKCLRELAEHHGIEIVGQYSDIDDGSFVENGLRIVLNQLAFYQADVIVVYEQWQLAHGKEGYAKVSRHLMNSQARVYTLLDLVAQEKDFMDKVKAIMAASQSGETEQEN